MPTKRLKPSSQEGLIAHIKDSLANHEEAYAPGAWENFSKAEKKNRGLVFWIGSLSSAAAILLLGVGLFLYFNKTEKPQTNKGTYVERSVKIPAAKSDIQVSLNALNQPNQIKHVVTPTAKNGSLLLAIERKEADQSAPLPQPIASPTVINKTAEQLALNPLPEPISQEGATAITEQPKNTTSKKPLDLNEFLAREDAINRNANVKTVSGQNKWDLGVVVAPSFGNTNKLNMGYGVSMAYNLTSKVSIGSGVSYNEMGASKEIVSNNTYDSPVINAIANDSKSLESVNTSVSGIDIPLELRYNLSSRFYANVGVSAFAVINQEQNNVYLQGSVVQQSSVNPEGGQQTRSLFITEKVIEKTPNIPGRDNKLIGFYNFSFGYKQQIYKDKFIGIEPFIKVPMKDVSKENLRIMGTGLKLKFEF